ncbi:MAG: acyl-CoA thioesterase [Melioribacteraceae bacterium]|nr:acyl-CoA thioesterase [Melioribacteraceae bacterium]MCF8354045.1 acyl-CoA thioesterase [Melioribacteraceae bacterium]MCF8392274.1 acyl-CoA thioesterase [Melioribacteraceae bacterium]MCF8417606.1 acyl-CoA thioesterase [Melioribacteraceae bacterium]
MYSVFESKITVRPDDIDMNNHVHYSKYLDYLLAARYEQMHRDYKMSMHEFIDRGFTWFVSNISIEFKRAMKLGDLVFVKTQIQSYQGAQSTVKFWMEIGEKRKLAAEGIAVYSLISTKSGRPVRIPQDIVEKYSI